MKQPPARAKKPRGLSEKERRFVEVYMSTGNITEAAKIAGYSEKTAASAGSRLLKRVKVRAAIADRAKSDPLVATREERQTFWTEVMHALRGKRIRMADRLKASELLGKSQADFVERRQVESLQAVEIRIVGDDAEPAPKP